MTTLEFIVAMSLLIYFGMWIGVARWCHENPSSNRNSNSVGMCILVGAIWPIALYAHFRGPKS